MEHLRVLDYEHMAPEAKKSIEKLKARLGKIPNGYAVMAHSSVALKAYMSFQSELTRGALTPQEIEAVALVITQAMDCLYCIAGHTVVAKIRKIPEEDIIHLRRGKSDDPKLNALVCLAKDIHLTQGHPHQENIDAFFAAGYTESALVELIAQIALNVYTSMLNKVARTPLDFPKAEKISDETGR